VQPRLGFGHAHLAGDQYAIAAAAANLQAAAQGHPQAGERLIDFQGAASAPTHDKEQRVGNIGGRLGEDQAGPRSELMSKNHGAYSIRWVRRHSRASCAVSQEVFPKLR
jgi:hypothetical protein